MYICEECGKKCDIREEVVLDTDEFWGGSCFRNGIYYYSLCCDADAYEGVVEDEEE